VDGVKFVPEESWPQVSVGHDSGVYCIAVAVESGCKEVRNLSELEADALYEHIRRERGDS